jgi:hypothetical protein
MFHKHSKCTEINAIRVNINLSYTEFGYYFLLKGILRQKRILYINES